MDNFLQNLRSHTAPQHSLLEQNTASKNLLSQQVTMANYAVYLSLLYGFVKGFENNVFPLIQNNITDIEETRKTHLMVSDLNKLGINETEITAIPDHIITTLYQSKAAALGGMYVLEGSVLGGAFIYKHLQATLGVEAIAGKATYFTAYGTQTGSKWKNFLQAFCTASLGMEQEVINSASQTFNLLHHWFNDTPIQLIQHES
jgi:heme oxygenase